MIYKLNLINMCVPKIKVIKPINIIFHDIFVSTVFGYKDEQYLKISDGYISNNAVNLHTGRLKKFTQHQLVDQPTYVEFNIKY